MKSLLSLLLIMMLCTVEVVSQPATEQQPDPKIAFLKSLAVPGWGHHHVNKSNWTRGQYHLGADAVLLLSYLGLSVHVNNVEQNWYAYGKSEAGVPIEGRSRNFQLAVGDYISLEAYNDYQLRSRNWDRLFEDRPENRWQWGSESERSRYNTLRSNFEQIDQQLPALLGMMLVNRVISGISAYNRAKKRTEMQQVSSTISVSPYQYSQGVVANINIHF